MINPRVQKLNKGTKDRIKGFSSLFHSKLKIMNHQRIIDQQKIIRILTGIQVSHLLLTIVDMSKNSEVFPLEDLKVGVIGCGVIGRMIVNDIIPLSKAGLKLQNVYISTRQTQNIRLYQDFGMQVQFNNEKVAQNSDVLIIATPATLDNWILIEIGKAVKQKRNKKDKNNQKSRNPLLFILTSGLNQKILRSYFGDESLIIIPYENFQGANELCDDKESLWQNYQQQSLNEFTLQQKVFRSFEKNIENFIQILGSFFQLNSSSISQKSYAPIRQLLQSPSLIDNYLQKYKRLKTYIQNL